METVTVIIDGKEQVIAAHALEKVKKLFGAVEKE
jgi:hypothetical protein